jgi:hypothetical protein
MNKYKGRDNYGRPKSDYINKLSAMSDKDLYDQTERMIWLSAYAANNPRSDFHWQCDACYDECAARDKVKKIYTKAWKHVSGNLKLRSVLF